MSLDAEMHLRIAASPRGLSAGCLQRLSNTMKHRVLLAIFMVGFSLSSTAKEISCGTEAAARAKALFLFHVDPEVKDSSTFEYSKPYLVKRPYKRNGNVLVQLEVIAQIDAKSNYVINLTYVVGEKCALVGEEIYGDWTKK